MSSTNRGAERVAFDAYYTPDALAHACVSVLTDANPDHVVEPSVGGGAFVRAVRARWPRARVSGYDLDPEAKGGALCDAFYNTNWLTIAPTSKPDVILGNPPYNEAEAHVRKALERVHPAGGTVGMLLRLAFLESKQRKPFWREWGSQLDSVYVLADRPSFVASGARDSCAYGWFVWRTGTLAFGQLVPAWSWRDTVREETPCETKRASNRN